MKNVKKIFAVSLALIMSAFFVSCGVNKELKSENTSNENTKYIQDCIGREVAVPENAEKIACLYAYTGHLAVLLESEQNICAVVDGLKRDALMRYKIPSIDSLVSPYNSGAINIEELAQADPDIIFLRASNLQDEGEIQKLDNLGIPYAVVEYITMEDQINSISVMGAALNKEETADKYIEYYRNTIDMIKQRLENLPQDEKKTVYHSVNEVVRTDIPDTLSYQVLETAGCINVVNSNDNLRLDGDKGYVTVEQIYVWDPDVILVNEPSAYEYFKTDSKFSGLRAVTQDSIIQLPVGLSRWAHPGSLESPIASLYIASVLYPEYFNDIDIREEIYDFYNEFFKITLTEQDIDTILSGNGMRAPREEN